ncbi:endonuclease-reverse transcriptase [Elysia marginata]|uniref:Endonuclease-reverse transcriptase n=1 Tax=Elysia marginata TaxID=1093978 RepID=A0AAV4IN03_9GAST|nr:endonuclease-reverse transcriptase [Elysia marginata]
MLHFFGYVQLPNNEQERRVDNASHTISILPSKSLEAKIICREVNYNASLTENYVFVFSLLSLFVDKVKQVTRLNLYRALVKSILLYNCGTWPLTKKEEHKLNTFHHRQFRTILNIKYLTVVKNNALYQKTGETPISLTILEARWRLFGHILRQAINTTPNVAMTKYFKTEGSKQPGRPKTSIVTSLLRDLKSHSNDHWPTRLHSITDFDHLRDIAQNRSDWKHLTTAIYRSAQAETSVDIAADRH